MKCSNRISLLVMLLVGAAWASSTHGALINGDFSDPSLINTGPGGSPMFYSHLNAGWVAKQGGIDWINNGGQLLQQGRTGSETRAAQFFTNELTGTGNVLELELDGPNNITSDNINVWVGIDDGNNQPTDNLMGLGGDGPPNNNIVQGSWLQVVDLDDVPTGQVSVEITQDLTGFDLMVIMINSPRGGGQPGSGLLIDNVVLRSALVPEPTSLALLCLGAVGIGLWRRRAE